MHWAAYADAASLNPAQGMRHRLALRALRQLGPIEVLLDAGCGQGDFLVKASQEQIAKQLVGLELSETGVAISRQKVPGAEVVQADLMLPFEPTAKMGRPADAAVCLDVIEHVDNPVTFLTTLGNYLKSDGVLIVTVPGGPMSAFDRHIGHRTHYSKESLSKILSQAGFSIQRVSLAGFPFFNLYRLLVIAAGRSLISSVDTRDHGGTKSALLTVVMTMFGWMFRANLDDSRFGWQVFAVARRRS
jgi:SAM-dependent methyltransferase